MFVHAGKLFKVARQQTENTYKRSECGVWGKALTRQTPEISRKMETRQNGAREAGDLYCYCCDACERKNESRHRRVAGTKRQIEMIERGRQVERMRGR